MSNIKTIELILNHIDHKGKLHYGVIYKNQAMTYHSAKERKAVIDYIIRNAQYNDTFSVYTHGVQLGLNEEFRTFRKLLNHKINKPKNDLLNLKILGAPENPRAQERQRLATKQQTEIMNSAKALLKKYSSFPRSIFSPIKSAPKTRDLSNKKTIKALNEIQRRLSTFKKALFNGSNLFYISAAVLILSSSFLAALITAGVCCVASVALTSFLDNVNQQFTPIHKLSKEFIDPSLIEVTPPSPIAEPVMGQRVETAPKAANDATSAPAEAVSVPSAEESTAKRPSASV